MTTGKRPNPGILPAHKPKGRPGFVSLQIIDAMRNHVALRQIGIVVVIDVDRGLGVASAVRVAIAQAFFFLAVDADDRTL